MPDPFPGWITLIISYVYFATPAASLYGMETVQVTPLKRTLASSP